MESLSWGLIPLPWRDGYLEKDDAPIESCPSGNSRGCSSFDSS